MYRGQVRRFALKKDEETVHNEAALTMRGAMFIPLYRVVLVLMLNELVIYTRPLIDTWY